MKNVCIVMPVINCWNFTKEALLSIKTNYHALHVVIVDNGSNDATLASTLAYIAKRVELGFHTFKMIENHENIGLTLAWNQGVQEARELGCEYVLIANNDIILNPYTIDNLVKALDEHPEWGMATAVNERGWCDANGGPFSVLTKTIPLSPTDAESPDFSCFMLKMATFDRVGEFDVEFSRRGRAYFEDNDYHYRMKMAGLPARCITSAPYYHYGSQTQHQNVTPIVPSEGFIANRDYFIEKWGGMPGSETYRTPFGR